MNRRTRTRSSSRRRPQPQPEANRSSATEDVTAAAPKPRLRQTFRHVPPLGGFPFGLRRSGGSRRSFEALVAGAQKRVADWPGTSFEDFLPVDEPDRVGDVDWHSDGTNGGSPERTPYDASPHDLARRTQERRQAVERARERPYSITADGLIEVPGDYIELEPDGVTMTASGAVVTVQRGLARRTLADLREKFPPPRPA